jgi:hypothetical protein
MRLRLLYERDATTALALTVPALSTYVQFLVCLSLSCVNTQGVMIAQHTYSIVLTVLDPRGCCEL